MGILDYLKVGWTADLEKQLAQARSENEKLKNECDILRRALEARAEGMGASSISVLSKYLRGLREAMLHQIAVLSEATKQHLPYSAIQEQIDLTRVRSRKDRFEAYSVKLRSAEIKIADAIEALKDDREILDDVMQRLSTGRLDPAAGVIELEAIAKVLRNLEGEAANLLLEDLTLKSRQAEYEKVLKFKDAMFRVRERLRKSDTPNPRLAKASVDPNDPDLKK
jgi:hypothetical protein